MAKIGAVAGAVAEMATLGVADAIAKRAAQIARVVNAKSLPLARRLPAFALDVLTVRLR